VFGPNGIGNGFQARRSWTRTAHLPFFVACRRAALSNLVTWPNISPLFVVDSATRPSKALDLRAHDPWNRLTAGDRAVFPVSHRS
jgi:hypothetical protein